MPSELKIIDKSELSAPVNVQVKCGKHFYAGFVAGLTSSVMLQPLDYLKTQMQLDPRVKTRPNIVLKHLASKSQLWTGLTPSILRTSLGSGAYFYTLQFIRTLWANNSGKQVTEIGAKGNVFAGTSARALVALLLMPVTVIKSRYESGLYSYNSIRAAVESINKTEGLKGFFSGYGATTLRDAPYAGIYLVFYEQLKFLLSSSTMQNQNYINMAASFIAATLSTILTNPFDVLKTRIQVEPKVYRNMLFACSIILRKELFSVVFDGLALRIMKKAASSTIAWPIYELLIRNDYCLSRN